MDTLEIYNLLYLERSKELPDVIIGAKRIQAIGSVTN